MPGHLDLRHHGDVPCLRVCEDLAHVVLRVEERPVGLPVKREVQFPVRPARLGPVQHGLRALRPPFDQFRMALELKPPALVVHEMPVEDVHLVLRHQVEIALHHGLSEEVARLVQHEAAPAVPRRVRDLAARHGAVLAAQLAHGLSRVELAGVVRRCDRDRFTADHELVSLCGDARVAHDVHRGAGLACPARLHDLRRPRNERQRRHYHGKIHRLSPCFKSSTSHSTIERDMKCCN